MNWVGSLPKHCDVCKCDLAGKPFVDGATRMGPWGIMCFQCHRDSGVGLGTGRGQAYNKDGSKRSG